MRRYLWGWLCFVGVIFAAVFAGFANSQGGVKVLAADGPLAVHEPFVHSNLALFPVTSAGFRSSQGYLTLDEGVKSGEVEVRELGVRIIRRRPGMPQPDQAQVNTLALVNHSKKALLLLAGEVVTGGKQDRVISKDRIIPPGAEPLPLEVFCVEPGRWHGSRRGFASGGFMAAPKLRQKAAVAKNQQEVWAANKEIRRGVAGKIAEGARDPAAVYELLNRSSSYAQLENTDIFKKKIDEASTDLERDYERALRGALKGKNVIGVVVAVNGEVVWADLFADPDLFGRYWTKLLRSYVVEALSVPVKETPQATVRLAEKFLTEQDGKQIIEVQPGEYRLTHIDNPRYSVFELASLWQTKDPAMMHISKLRKESPRQGRPVPIGPHPLPQPLLERHRR